MAELEKKRQLEGLRIDVRVTALFKEGGDSEPITSRQVMWAYDAFLKDNPKFVYSKVQEMAKRNTRRMAENAETMKRPVSTVSLQPIDYGEDRGEEEGEPQDGHKTNP